MKTVYSFDLATGLFLGAVQLNDSDRSPLEPDVWHIPGYCVEVPPPVAGPDQFCRWNGVDWELATIPVAAPEEPKEVDPKAAALQEIADLEAQVSPRRMREAILTGDNAFILSIEKKIVGIRKTLKTLS